MKVLISEIISGNFNVVAIRNHGSLNCIIINLLQFLLVSPYRWKHLRKVGVSSQSSHLLTEEP